MIELASLFMEKDPEASYIHGFLLDVYLGNFDLFKDARGIWEEIFLFREFDEISEFQFD